MRKKLNREIIMDAVMTNPNKTQAQLATIMGCAQSTVSKYIRELVDNGDIHQTVDTSGVYHYSIPEQPIVIEQPIKQIEPIIIDGYEKFMTDVKNQMRTELDKRVRTYLNEQYVKMMKKLVEDLSL